MVLALIAVLVGGAGGLAGGGRVGNIERVDLRFLALPAVWVGLGVWARRGDGSLRFAALLVSMVCLLAFLVLNAVRMPGLWLVAFGIGLNLFMTANNHGMPYDPGALEKAGIVPSTYGAVPKSTVAAHPERSGDQMVILGQVIPIRPLRTVVSFGDLFVSFGLGAATMNALVGTSSSRRDAVGRPRHRRGAAAADPPLPVASAAQAAVASEPVQQSESPFDDPEILQVVALLDDGRAVLDLTAASDAATDVVELSARHAVRQALERHGLPGTLLRTEPSDRPT